MTRREIFPLHTLAKLERQYRFLYFLRDLGITSAHDVAVDRWMEYQFTCARIMDGGS